MKRLLLQSPSMEATLADKNIITPLTSAYRSQQYDIASKQAQAMGCMVIEDLANGKIYPAACFENAEIQLLEFETLETEYTSTSLEQG